MTSGQTNTKDEIEVQEARIVRLEGYLPSSREVEFTYPETGAVAYGKVERQLAETEDIPSMVGRVVVASGRQTAVEWSFPLSEHATGFVIRGMAAL